MHVDDILPALDLPAAAVKNKSIPPDIIALVGRAEDGSEEALDLRRLLDRHPELPEFLGNVVRLLENYLIGVTAGGSQVTRLSIEKYIARIRRALLAEGDSPTDVLLIDRLVVCLLDVSIRQARAQAAVSNTESRRRQRLLDQAARRQLKSFKAYAELRRKRRERKA
jgi:hypothetical protein